MIIQEGIEWGFGEKVSELHTLKVASLVKDCGSKRLKQAILDGNKIWVEGCEESYFYGVFLCRDGISHEELSDLLDELQSLCDPNLEIDFQEILNHPPLPTLRLIISTSVSQVTAIYPSDLKRGEA